MKFNSSVLISSLFIASVMAAPAAIESRDASSLDIIANSTELPIVVSLSSDPMSGTVANASITISGQNVTAQSISGSGKTFSGASSIALSIAIVSGLLLM